MQGYGISMEIQRWNISGLPQLLALSAARAELTALQLLSDNLRHGLGWQGARCKELTRTKEGCAH